MQEKRPYGDGVITGTGTIDGRNVAVFSQDATVFGGSLGEVYGQKIVKVMDFALKTGIPMIGINDGGGARIQEGVVALGLYGEIFMRNVRSSGVIPQISLIMGACAGGAVYSPAITDFTVMVDQTSHMFITGPDVIKTVTGEDVEMEDLGGGRAHNTKSGVAHYLAANEADALSYVKELLSFLPSNNLSDPPSFPAAEPIAGSIADSLDATDLELDSVIPDSPNQPYDMHEVITRSSTKGSSSRSTPCSRRTSSSGSAGSRAAASAWWPTSPPSSPVASTSTPRRRRPGSCAPATRSTCPVLTFVDVPGFLPGTTQEWDGIIRRGAKLIYAYAEATVPKVTVITRKAYGGAYDVMGSKHLGADINIAWPTAQIAVTGSAGAVNILYRKELKDLAGDELAAKRAELQQHYEDTLANPYIAADRGYVDGVIPPSHTRGYVGRALRALATKREAAPTRKHGNIPL